mgnify:CR=1 FL=1
MFVGNNISKFRKEQNLTQEKLADLIHVSNKAISSYENNRNLPNIETLILLSEVLDVSINDILGIKANHNEELKDKYKKQKKEELKIFITLGIFSLIYIFVSNYIISGSLLSLNSTFVKKDILKVIIIGTSFYGLVAIILYGIYYLKLEEKKPLVTMFVTFIVVIILGLVLYNF